MMSDDVWVDIKREQKYQDGMLAKIMKMLGRPDDGGEYMDDGV